MNKDEKKPYKRVSSDEQAYDDLLSFYSSDTKPHRPSEHSSTQSAKAPASRPASNNAKSFKLDIKDIDSEFNKPVRRAPVKREQSPHTQIYKKPEPAAKRPTQRNSEKPVKSADEYGKIDLMPAFEDDRRYIKKREAVKPEYKSEPQRQAASERKKPVQKKASLFLGKKKKPQGDVPYKKPEIVHDENGRAIIVKKNEVPPKKRIELFFKQNKKAWVLIAVCIAAAVLISTYAISCMNDILAIGRDSETVVTVNIPAQTDTKGAIEILRDNKLIKHKYFCRICAKVLEYRDDNYLTGIYYLTESMGLENMLSSFKKPTVTGETVTLTFPEGYTVNQIAEKLEKYEVCSQTAFFATVRDVDFSTEYSFIAQIDNKDKRYQVLEGYLYPDTYEFYIGENASSVIRKFLDNFNNKWTDEYKAQADKIGMSIDDVITLASIIEKEAYGADQMPLVSSVFHNRLNKSGIYPTLGSDATKEYVSEYISKSVTNSAELSSYQKNYDTYKCAGLPVGAICNPGNDAIKAALFPANTGYYYFLHDNDKKIYLAATDSEHNQNSLAALKANSKKTK
ncbi:MAG: endolytic transglycosylase MltG [Ruminococcus sp.]|nr:endolytic transglycosylase MltG [Ruminococcus sp.]